MHELHGGPVLGHDKLRLVLDVPDGRGLQHEQCPRGPVAVQLRAEPALQLERDGARLQPHGLLSGPDVERNGPHAVLVVRNLRRGLLLRFGVQRHEQLRVPGVPGADLLGHR